MNFIQNLLSALWKSIVWKFTLASIGISTSVPLLSRPFKCNVCYSTSFADVSELNQHNEYFHPKPFKCDICFDTSFLKLHDLNLHIERFHPKKLQCHLCSEASFSEYSHLKQHIQGIKCWNCVLNFAVLKIIDSGIIYKKTWIERCERFNYRKSSIKSRPCIISNPNFPTLVIEVILKLIFF